MRIYLSGPVTGQEETARRRFNEALLGAVRMAWKTGETFESTETINPYEVNLGMTSGLNRESVTHAEYMTVSIALLSICDAIYMMQGWQQSEGCKQEYKYASEHGYKIFYQEANEP